MRKSILLLACFTLLYSNITVAQYSWARDAANPVLTGAPTTIQHLADPSVIYDSGMFRMWSGCVETNPSYASICYSESTDGSNWTAPVIVFSPSLVAGAWDNMKTEIPTVIKDTTEIDPAKRYKMWYGGADSLKPDSTIMGYAYSPDGLAWTRLPAAQSPYGKDGLVLVAGFVSGDAFVISDPTVIKTSGTYYVWYNTFDAFGNVVISHATSSDGINWTKDPSNPVVSPTEPWEDFGPDTSIVADVVQPTVMIHPATGDFFMCFGSFDSTIYQRYDGFGYATSADGTTWAKDISNPFFLPDTLKPGEEIGIHANNIVYVAGTYHMFYGGVNNLGVRNILHATSTDTALAVKEEYNPEMINIFPNPTTGIFTLEITLTNAEYLQIEIVNVLGQIVFSEKLQPNAGIYRKQIDLSAYAKGSHFIQLKGVDGIISRKLLLSE